MNALCVSLRSRRIMELPKYIIKAFKIKEVKEHGTNITYEETEAIPISWIEEWCKCLRENINNVSAENFNVYKERCEEYLKMERLLSMMIEYWRKENDTN